MSEGHWPFLLCTAAASPGTLGALLGIAEHKGHKTMKVCPKESTGRGPQGKELQHQDCWSSRSIQTTLGDMVCHLGSCLEAEVGLDNPCVSFLAQDILGFYDRG